MQEYKLSLTHIFQDNDRRFCPYIRKYGSAETPVLINFMQCKFTTSNGLLIILGLSVS